MFCYFRSKICFCIAELIEKAYHYNYWQHLCISSKCAILNQQFKEVEPLYVWLYYNSKSLCDCSEHFSETYFDMYTKFINMLTTSVKQHCIYRQVISILQYLSTSLYGLCCCICYNQGQTFEAHVEYSNKYMHVLLKVPLNITVVLYTSCQTSLCEHGQPVKPSVKQF